MNNFRTQQISKRLNELFLDGTWIAGTNFKNEIEALTWQEAVAQVINANSIAKLVFHINYYLKGLLEAFKTGALTISDRFSFEMPSIESEEEWESMKNEFMKNSIDFIQYVHEMKDEQLDLPFIDKKYGDMNRNIEGVLEHGYYHLGQIRLIRKWLSYTKLNEKTLD